MPPISNQILAALPQEESQHLSRYLQPVWLEKGQILYRAEDEIRTVYFPEQALISLVMISQDGNSCDAGIIGSEGMIGSSVVLGSRNSATHTTTQIAGTAQQLEVKVLESEFGRNNELQRKLLQFTQILLLQTMQTAMYSTLYTAETRLARWLLLAQESTQLNELPLTQELLAQMLGVRRATVSEIATSWGRQNLIKYNRGRIVLKHREAIEKKAGEEYYFYQTKRQQYLAQLPLPSLA